MANITCSFPECVKAARARGWCSTHYERWRKHGSPDIVLDPVPPPASPRTQLAECRVDGCRKAPWARNLCDAHYQKFRKYGDATADHARKRLTCEFDGCVRKVHGHGWCTRHYRAWRVHGSADYKPTTYDVCAIPECVRSPRSRTASLCDAHYCKRWRNGSLNARHCAGCGTQFPLDASTLRLRCPRCALIRRRDRAKNQTHARRALMLLTQVEQISSQYVFTRDRWLCHICRKRVDNTLSYPHPRSASLDHVVPLIQGGSHTRANVRLAHLHCNTSRGARGGNEQLLLFG
jgi:DNA-directed RNA polymerase subunit RPC12/RpoP